MPAARTSMPAARTSKPRFFKSAKQALIGFCRPNLARSRHVRGTTGRQTLGRLTTTQGNGPAISFSDAASIKILKNRGTERAAPRDFRGFGLTRRPKNEVSC